MDIKEKAQEYAKDKMQQVLNDAIAEAYMEGYKQGYEDGKAEVPVKHENDDIEYVDLGLPSGTLWAKDYSKKGKELYPLFFTYAEAKNLNIPSYEQLVELYSACQYRFTKETPWTPAYSTFIGPNKKEIKYQHWGYFTLDRSRRINHVEMRFWLRDPVHLDNDKKVAFIARDQKWEDCMPPEFKLPVLLVK